MFKREFKMEDKNFDGPELLTLLMAVLLPPLGVFFKVGLTSHFWVNIILTIFGFYFLGLIHALYVVIKNK
jgi:uncharacterized membrane protein YqaE (UPF0057 family)